MKKDFNLFSSPDVNKQHTMKLNDRIRIKKSGGYYPLHQIGDSVISIKNTPLLKSEATSNSDLNQIVFPGRTPAKNKNTHLESLEHAKP